MCVQAMCVCVRVCKSNLFAGLSERTNTNVEVFTVDSLCK